MDPGPRPVVLVAVCRADEVLLVRHSYIHQETWALVGGVVEVGESLERAAHREVSEEVGVEITDLRYRGSQPWGENPPGMLLAAFTARWVTGEPVPDAAELLEAQWFRLGALPADLPAESSIARRVLEELARSGHPRRLASRRRRRVAPSGPGR